MEDFGKLGPKMAALPNDRWRTACLAYLEGRRNPKGGNHNKGYVDALIAAGYEGTPGSLYVAASRMFHDDRMLAAIQEQARGMMVNLLPMAMEAIADVVSDPQHKDRLAAAKTIADRTGLHAVTETRTVAEVEITPEKLQRARMLAQRMGVPLDTLIGTRLAAKVEAETTTDAEYVEIPKSLQDVL